MKKLLLAGAVAALLSTGAFAAKKLFVSNLPHQTTDENLSDLADLKSKDELIGDIITLLQSPAKNVISSLQSGGNKLSGIVKALEERAN